MDIEFELFEDENDENEMIFNVVNAVVNENLPQAEDFQHLEGRNEVVRNQHYFEVIIPRYTDFQFREHFRMSRGVNEPPGRNERKKLRGQNNSFPKKILFTIWILSKPESFLAAGDRFGLAKSSAYEAFKEILDFICQTSPQYIQWPNRQKLLRSTNVFMARSRGIPGVIGAIDGCHIPIKQPEGNAVDYFNRKGFHSIILQGICNEDGIFIDTTIGMPGRMHDARVFRLSEISRRITEQQFLSRDMHLIGDSAYPLMVNLMKPFQDNGHLTPQQIIYNTKLSSIRSIIERTFALLKCKFRRLKFLDVETVNTGNKIILASCILHNFILIRRNPQDDYNVENIVLLNENEGVIGNNDDVVGAAERKRFEIVVQCNN